MSRFDTFVVVDWSGGNDRGPTAKKDAIWACIARDGQVEGPVYQRNRQVAEDWLRDLVETEIAAGRRLLIGFDFPFGYSAGFCRALTGNDDPLALWDWIESRIEDAPKGNNRFDLAGEINRRIGNGRGPFWGNGLRRDIDGLPRNKANYANDFAERRACETLAKGSFSCWQLSGAGAVGSQVLMGVPVLARLRRQFSETVAVWPFEPLDTPVALVEIWPGLINPAVKQAEANGELRDAAQVRLLVRALSRLDPATLGELLAVDAPEEGWIMGLGHEERLMKAASTPIAPPPLRNDCFALPAGVAWTPVEDALDMLRTRLRPVTRTETIPLQDASGRVLAQDVIAARSNPPLPNSAVDGYGFAGGALEGPHVLPLIEGRAAAGVPFDGIVPAGHAIRILTGAAVPGGVDTVILEEDVTCDGRQIAFRGPLKSGANTRKAGEDVVAGDVALRAGREITAVDLALMSAVGVAHVPVRKRLRVAVLSTGDELVEPGEAVAAEQIFDANRPMLLSMARAFGFDPVDLGRVADDREALRDQLDAAAKSADVILTSGGASAGDEDHVSALLQQAGAMQEWRIAIKPGRPLALGLWHGVPVFGLPGNPVAAMVCTLVFARPAMSLLAGAAWREPQGFDVPAAFEKRKKPGRREYLRARMRDGRAEVFASEGSGRISGLSWADGLVEIGDGARHIRPGDTVRFIPYGGFGL
ncbi:molybdopterin-binding protein [Sedimentitalea todarodis]|uniref:Molybdopterin molybdenumtransferase n=1 Tax=Sedimentitalea todarodis TaxID=1631240 RepID=A0ABU3VIY1_9RHOB|nr:gephyrin-like molybdotransferase Glp [Sedimentitalea todarodis]MDU9005654.1 molybdopterin-binding protein [Sedimentitalea todarodis]